MAEIKLPAGAIGKKDQLKPEQLKGMHIDSKSGYVFKTDKDYIVYKNSLKK